MSDSQASQPPARPKVLLVDDQPANLLVLTAVLEDLALDLVEASSGEQALRRLLEDDFAVVLLDVQMASMDGYETAERIRRQERSRHTPIIFITAFDSDRPAIERAYELGAVDYLVKPIMPGVLRAKVATFVDLFQKAQQIEEQARRLRQAEREEFERRLAEEALRQAEARLRLSAIVEGSLDAIVGKSLDGIITSWNAGAEQLYGYAADEVIGRPVSILLPPDQPDEWPSILERLQRSEKIGHYESLRVRKDGRRIDVSVRISPLVDAAGRLIGASAIARDITQQKQTERRRNARLAVTQILADARDLEQAAPAILQAVCESLEWDVGVLWEVLSTDQLIRCVSVWHQPAAQVQEFVAASRCIAFPRNASLPGRVWASGRPLWIANVVSDPNFVRADVARREGLHGALACPVRLRDETLGVIEFFSREIREPDQDLLEMMVTLGGQIGQFMERKRAEEAAQARQRQLELIADNAPVLIAHCDTENRFKFVNRPYAARFGLQPHELIGRTVAQVLGPEADAVLAPHLQAALSGKRVEFEAEIPYRDIERQVVLSALEPEFDSNGQTIGYVAAITNITERKRVEQALRQSEQRFARFMQQVPGLAWIKDAAGHYVYANDAAVEAFGCSREKLYGSTDGDLFPPDVAARFQEHDRQSLQSSAGVQVVETLQHSDGAVHHSLVTKFAIPTDDGGAALVGGMAIDITDRARFEDGLRFLADASASLAAIVDFESTLQKVAGLAVPHFADWCAVDIAEADGTLRRLAVAHVDPAKVKLARELHERYPPDRQTPQGAYHVLHTGRAEMLSDIPDELLVAATRSEEHLRILRELGLRSFICVPLQVRGKTLGVISFVTAESGRRYTASELGFAEELARRAAISIENAQLYQELREADRRKDEFLATLAHELRNPLAPIRNSLQILKMPRLDAETAEHTRQMMERQVQHLVRLVDDLLDVSRVMRGKIDLRHERIELASVVARAVETAQPLIEAQGHELTVELPPESLVLEADPVRLAQVFGNLLTNAAKYTEPGGKIWLSARREGGDVAVRVRDTGIGIPPEMLPRIFELFVQIDSAATRSQGGLGVGLTLVKNLVEMHHGKVEASSAGLGGGSEFTVRLPLAQPAEPAAEPPTAETPQHGEPSGHRLLVVDDNADAAASLAMLLRLQGHDVRIAHDGPSALEMLNGYQPDLIFLDIGMPGMDGYEVARRLRQRRFKRPVKVVALTGWGQQEDRRRTAEAGFDHHLVKPVEPRAIDELLQGLRRSPS